MTVRRGGTERDRKLLFRWNKAKKGQLNNPQERRGKGKNPRGSWGSENFLEKLMGASALFKTGGSSIDE